MVGFLQKVKRTPRETVTIAETMIEVRGLTYGELAAIARPRNGEKTRDVEAMTRDLIVASCYTKDGKKLIPEDEDFAGWNPVIVRALGEAVARVNGAPGGNSRATDGEDSASA